MISNLILKFVKKLFNRLIRHDNNVKDNLDELIKIE